jgi:hypothetical protein
MSLRIAAAFDALAVTSALTATAGGAAVSEIHVFAYFACLLGVYEGKTPDEWQYAFTATPAGAPYAHILGEEIDRLRAAGRLLEAGDVLVLSTVGEREHETLQQFGSLVERSRYISAACATTHLRPLPSVADALSYEPQLQDALSLSGSRELLSTAGQLLLAPHFAGLREVLAELAPKSEDLLVPASLWLSYLAVSGQRASAGFA